MSWLEPIFAMSLPSFGAVGSVLTFAGWLSYRLLTDHDCFCRCGAEIQPGQPRCAECDRELGQGD